MPKFSELLQPQQGVSTEDLQRQAQAQFPTLLKECGLLYASGQPVPQAGNFLLIGIAAGYSKSDLSFLDEIRAVIVHKDKELVCVFDVSVLKKMEDIEKFIPGLTPVYQTPVIGFWVNGQLIVKKTGKEASNFLRAHYNLSL